jgi:hypothetical protein
MGSFVKSLISVVLFSFTGLISFGQRGDRLPDSTGPDQTNNSPKKQDTIKSDSVHQLESAEDSSNESAKDDDIRAEDSIQFRAVPDSVVKKMKQDKDFAYANNPAYWTKAEYDNRNDKWFRLVRWFRHNIWVTRFLYLILGGIVLLTIYVIAIRNRLFIFYSSPRKLQANDEANVESSVQALEEKIEAAIQAGNYRQAVRYMYLRTLRTADEKGIIKFAIQKTNQEYISQLRGKPIAREFGFLTSVYEWSWYGGFDIRPEQFRTIREHFDLLNKKMNH